MRKRYRSAFGEFWPVWMQYAMTMAVLIFALGVRLLLDPILGDDLPYATVYPAVAFAAYFGGLGPALFTALLGALAGDYFFLGPRFALALPATTVEIVHTGIYIFVSLVIAVFGSSTRGARVEAESKSYEAELAQSKLIRTLESITDCFYTLDREWRFTYVNGQAEAYFDRHKNSMLYREIWTILPELEGTEVERSFRRAMAEQVPTNFEVLSADTKKWIEVAAYPSADGLSVYFKDISQRKRAEEALKQSEARFRHMGDACPAMLWLCNNDKRRTWSNKAWLDFVGHSAKEELAERWIHSVHEDDRERTWQTFTAAIEAGQPFKMEYRLRRFDGEYRWVLDQGIPWSQPNGKFVGYIGSCMDITENKLQSEHLERKVAERTARLHQSVVELEALSYTIVHDMRAPLRCMQNFSQLIIEECGEQLSTTGKDYLRRIISAAQRMDRLILDVLSYSRLARGEVHLQEVNFEQVLRGIIETYPPFQAPNATIYIDGPLPSVTGNEALLTQCIANLLGNAVKFVAPEVHPRVKIWVEESGGMARFWFEDNGVGIPADAHEKIFGMFERLNQNYEGTGIGLAIVRKAAERMGGKVGVESEVSQGSRFWLQLIAARAIDDPKKTAVTPELVPH
jgi:PAS domain S-box-containing protein